MTQKYDRITIDLILNLDELDDLPPHKKEALAEAVDSLRDYLAFVASNWLLDTWPHLSPSAHLVGTEEEGVENAVQEPVDTSAND